MTTEQIYQKYNNEFHLEGNNGGIQKHKYYILNMLQEFGRLMCDKQKEICAVNTCGAIGILEQHGIEEMDELVLQSPYPEELL